MVTNDINALHLRRALTEIAEDGAPGGVDLWPKVSARLRKGRRLDRQITRSRLAWGLPLVAIIAAIGAASVTAVPLIVDSLNSILVAEHGEETELGPVVELNLTETLEGFQVSLDSVRISELRGANGMVKEGFATIEWTVFDSPDQSIVGPRHQLYDSDGAVLDDMTGISTDRTSDLFGDEVPEGTRIFGYLFNLEGAKVEDGELRLVMEFHLKRLIASDTATGPSPLATPELLSREDGTVFGAIPGATPPAQTEDVGAIRFEFVVPVDSGLKEWNPRSSLNSPDSSSLLQATPAASMEP